MAKKKVKAILASRTVWLSIVQGFVGVALAVFSTDPTLQLTGVGAIVKSFVDFWLRLNTKEEVA